jgi:signal transduction histidine kinase
VTPVVFKQLNIGLGLKLSFALLLLMILGGNAVLIWQFHIAKQEADHLSDVGQALNSVLRLQTSVFMFHQGLAELARSHDQQRLRAESERLKEALYKQLEQTREILSATTDRRKGSPSFLPALESMELSIDTQLDTVNALASAHDWDAVQLRIDKKQAVESKASALVDNVNEEFTSEQSRTELKIRSIGTRILMIVPASAILTFCIAVFFAWTIARRVAEVQLEERMGERTRVARELHDTLLQGFQGLIIRLHTGVELISAHEPAKAILRDALNLADVVLAEGRNSIHDLRAELSERPDLAEELGRVADGFSDRVQTAFSLETTGAARDFDPRVHDEILGIAREALMNAFLHAQASRIQLELGFGGKHFRFVCRDDGCGIPAGIQAAGRAPGRYGLIGMRERAFKLNGVVRFAPNEPTGTVVVLEVPAKIAYKLKARRLAARL